MCGLLVRARQVRDLAELVGGEGPTAPDIAHLALDAAFAAELLDKGTAEPRCLDDTLAHAWRLLAGLPRHELTMLPTAQLDEHLPDPT